MEKTDGLPISPSELERLRLKVRKRLPTSGTGTLVRRRLGESLEYREHRAYQPGDDVRNVDWRASARTGRKDQLLVRTYEAEEQISVLIAVDLRPSMRLPQEAPKLLFAQWITRCLARLTAREDLKVACLRLYGPTETVSPYLGGAAAIAAADRFAQRLGDPIGISPRGEEVLNASTMVAALPQSSATILISDFYMRDLAPVIRLVRQASRGFRQVVLCELDSWPAERALLEGQMVQLAGVGDAPPREGEFEPTISELDKATHDIGNQREQLRTGARGGGIIHTAWHAPAVSLTTDLLSGEFRSWFPKFAMASELFGSRG